MKLFTFIAESAPEAVAQIRAQLGPEAVVLNVRKLESDGLQKIWRKPRIEVVAHVPEPEPPAKADPLQALSELRREIADLKQQFPREAPKVVEPVVIETAAPARISSKHNYGGWKVGAFLEQTGLLPVHVQRIIDHIEATHGERAPESSAKEFDLARGAILELGNSQNLPTSNPAKVHVFVGPPGSGKTTALSKMLAKHALIEGLPARVLRLDGARSNTAESLSVYAEILGVPVERCLTPEFQIDPNETTFIDLPGIPANDPEGIKALGAQIAMFPGAQVHLTLNAAYEISTLLAQARAFTALRISWLIFTHIDEEQRWGKLLNFVFGTKCSLGSLSAGQNVPGELVPATLEKILSRVIPSK